MTIDKKMLSVVRCLLTKKYNDERKNSSDFRRD